MQADPPANPAPPASFPPTGPAPPGDQLGALRLALCTPVREYPPLGDRKAVSLLGMNSLMVSVLLFFSNKIVGLVDSEGTLRVVVSLALLIPLAVLALMGCVWAFRALTLPMPASPKGLAFYSHIGALDLDDYRRRVWEVDRERVLDDMIHYNYTLSVLALAKFRLIDRSIRTSRVVFLLFGAMLLNLVL